MSGHAIGCRSLLGEHSDAAKRVHDTYSLHIAVDRYGSIGKWFAVSLAEGFSDGILYDSKRDCVQHQHHNEMYYAYVCIRPMSMSVCDAEIFLNIQRRLYDKGIRMADPDDRHGGKELIKRASVEDMRSLMRSVERGGKAQNLDYGGKS
jgi:hypothetical protein